ncbi:DUF1848 domain-containing protein [Candidatus Chloroploca sp. Khr17]|uniref:DUF1848 domain-containing protein n=1 Tax=Candidatus Chloroploca sp. Khr17 TaxID=2496869 RepID=UPI00101C4F4C|nr:DUF1848 domain-containing protein [Candidatus Chloroploca sp. Khr17]
MHVLSVSYRTDIPAFYGDWFMQRVREGYVRYHNPYGPQVVTVSLRSEDVRAIVFWSKHYGPFLRHLDELDRAGLACYFHYSLTGYTAERTTHPLEERVPQPDQVIESFQALARHYSHKHVLWRYDPIIFTPLTDADWHRRTFRTLAQRLAGSTERCYFSFLDGYDKVARNTRKLPDSLRPYDPPQNEKLELAGELASIAEAHGIGLYTCAEDFAVVPPIQRGACVDKELIDELWPDKQQHKLKLSPNRNKCGCYDSRDIGAYDTCPHGCVYCYAVINRPLALKRYKEHDVEHDALIKRGPKQPPEEDLPPQQFTIPLDM